MYRKAVVLLASSSSAMSAFHASLLRKGITRDIISHNKPCRLSNTSMNLGPSFCEKCGTTMQIKIPQGDERERHVCGNTACGFVSYQNPKVVVGAICTHLDRVLLCKRAIEPCKGKWG